MVANPVAVLVDKGKHKVVHKSFARLHVTELGLGSSCVGNKLLEDMSSHHHNH
jgi:hypothetical protein